METAPVAVQALRMLPGASAGLVQKTALLTCTVRADLQAWQQRCQPRAADWQALLPQQSLVLGNLAPEGFPHWLLLLSLAIQREARDAVWLGRVIRSGAQGFTLALPYERPEVLRAALDWALQHLALWADPAATPERRAALSEPYRAWLETVQVDGLSPNSLRFALAAFERRWPVAVEAGIVHVGWGVNQQRLDGSFTGQTGHLAARSARFKSQSGLLLRQAGLPVPTGELVASWPQALEVARRLGWPLVVKPEHQDQGLGVVTGIRDEQALQQAFAAADACSPGAVLVQRHVSGLDYRLLVVKGRLLMATCRQPGGVVGDGQHTVAELVARINRDPRRGTDQRSLLMRLELDAEALTCLAQQSLSGDAVPAAGQSVWLRRTANISRGGMAVDVSEAVHPDNRLLALRAARIIGLDLAGVDLICPDISRSWQEVGGAICEVNAQPGFRPHWLADPGRDINGEILDLLYEQSSPRIPTVAITGTNGKSTTARMLHHIWLAAGRCAAVCTTQGVWIGADQVSSRNLSGLPGAQMILRDPAVEVGIFEMPRKGLIHYGHPCDRYDVGVLMNVQDDHIGQDGVAELEQMALLKAQVLERSSQVAILNADDPRCLSAGRRSDADRLILVAQSAENPELEAHRRAGGEAVFLRTEAAERLIVAARGSQESVLLPCQAIAASMDGLLRFNELNAMFAAAAAWAHGLDPLLIRSALETFSASLQCNPGRYNVVQQQPFTVLLDYAHNPDGVIELCRVVQAYRDASQLSGRCHLFSVAVGGSHRHHIDRVAPHLVATFASFVLSNDADDVAASSDYGADDPAGEMLAGFRRALIAQGAAEAAITCLPARSDDWRTVLHQAAGIAIERVQPGEMLVILADPYVARNALRECGVIV